MLIVWIVSVYLANLTSLKHKHASTCDELDVLRVEMAELKSRPALLGACTSCPVLHGKIDEMHAYTVSLEAKLKELVPTSCSTCEVHALKKLELAHYVNLLQDENDELRKMMGWLSGHEPQLRMMTETYKRLDGQALGSEKVGESSGEGGEKIGDIQAPPITYHKNAYAPPTTKQTRHKESEKPSEEKPDEQPSGEKPNEQPQPKPKPKLMRFHCDYCGRDGHKGEFCFKKKCEERMAKKWANKDKYHPSNGVLEPRV
jgi:hypothetical protein